MSDPLIGAVYQIVQAEAGVAEDEHHPVGVLLRLRVIVPPSVAQSEVQAVMTFAQASELADLLRRTVSKTQQ